MTILLFFFGIVLLIFGAELLVRGASRLAFTLGLSPLVVGLTVVAFGTSAPEFAVTLQAALAGQADLAIGNIIGSNITNVLLILGLAALITPLVVAPALTRIDLPIMVGVALLMYGVSYDGLIGRGEGMALVVGIVAYTIFTIQKNRQTIQEVQPVTHQADIQVSWVSYPIFTNLLMLIGGLGCLAIGARWIVDGAVVFATAAGVSKFVIGLTIVAAGTSLPEIAATVVASLRGERDIAVGNVVGSSIFNILAVLGLASAAAPHGIAVSAAALSVDLPIMMAVAVICIPIFLNGHVIWRWEGGLLLGYYVAYVTYQLLNAAHSPTLPLFTWTMRVFVLPLTVIIIVFALGRSWVSAKRQLSKAAYM